MMSLISRGGTMTPVGALRSSLVGAVSVVVVLAMLTVRAS
jgi:hypothetical protein